MRPWCSVVLDETVHITLNNSHHTLFNVLREHNLVIVLNCYHFNSKAASAETNILTSCPLRNLPVWSSLQLTSHFFATLSVSPLTSYFILLCHCSRYFFCQEVKLKNAVIAMKVLFRNNVLDQNASWHDDILTPCKDDLRCCDVHCVTLEYDIRLSLTQYLPSSDLGYQSVVGLFSGLWRISCLI